jgi:transposase
MPRFAERCRQLTAARENNQWLAEGSVIVQQQAIRDYAQAMTNFFAGTHRRPTWRKAGRDEGFRIVHIPAMTRSAAGSAARPGRNVRQKAGLNRGILGNCWGLLVRRLDDKAPGRVHRITPAYTSQRCAACGRVDAKSRKSQAVFACTACGYACHADVNAARNIAAGHAVTARGSRALAQPANREPQPLASLTERERLESRR